MAAVNEQIAGMQDGSQQPEGLILALWMQEAERRLEELRAGTVKGIEARQAFRKAREEVGHSRRLR